MNNSKQSFLESLLTLLAPTLKIRHKRWKTPWEQRERKAFKTSSRVFSIFFSLAYLLHYFLIDLPLKKQPVILWAEYRFGLAALASATFVLTFTKWFSKTPNYRLPLIVTGLAFSLMQAESMGWRAEVPYFYSIIIPIICAVSLRKSIFESVLFLITAYSLNLHGWQTRPTEIPYIFSMAVVGIVFTAILRSRMSSDVEAFIAEQDRLETQIILIEAQKEFNDQIRSFLPREIFRRITNMMEVDKKTIVQAMDEVLRARDGLVTCIHSDIRGFTGLSKALKEYAPNAVLPNQKMCTDIVESHSGIPRLTGDLLFAYFDSPDVASTFHQAILCAFALTEATQNLNKFLPKEQNITRYILISFGKGTTGNTGGTEGSREITVFGDPANILSRIDPITKDQNFKSLLSKPSLILTEEAATIATTLFQTISFNKIDIHKLGISLRDFPEEKFLYLIPVDQENRSNIANINIHDTNKLLSEKYKNEIFQSNRGAA